MLVAKTDLLKWLSLAEAAYTTALPPGFTLISRITANPTKTHLLTRLDPTKTDFGFVASENATGDVHVWFRGTQDTAEWIDDGEAVLVSHPDDGMVHAGFFSLFECLRLECSAAPLAPPHRIVCGGHSLGAALASYAAVDHSPRILVTFEGPRPGDDSFADSVEYETSIHLRIVNELDVVTHLPPRPIFSHAGGTINFRKFSTDVHTAHSLELAVAPAIAAMPDQVETQPNQR